MALRLSHTATDLQKGWNDLPKTDNTLHPGAAQYISSNLVKSSGTNRNALKGGMLREQQTAWNFDKRATLIGG